MSILLKVACPDCGFQHDSAVLGVELRCQRCGKDFRAIGDGEGASRVLSVSSDEQDNIPYSQRSIEVPVNSVSNVILSDPELLSDKLLRELPLKQNIKWVGKVRLVKKLGQGGMGAVYRGYDEGLALDVAVKILPMPLGERDPAFIERFRQEARISAQINHPNVVRTLHVDEQNDVLYLVMDFLEGQTARKLVDSKGPLPLPLALQIIHDATKGMQAAHDRSVVHRDIKPENILVGDDGRVLLADLGLAKAISSGNGNTRTMPVTRMGVLMGTPEYMSPEQWDIYGVVGPQSDIWSMGATLWLLLTHRPLFDNRDMGALARAIKDQPIPDIRDYRESVPESVVTILERCLAKKAEDRYQTAAELVVAVNGALNDLAGLKGAVKVPAAVEKEFRAPVPARPVMTSAIQPDAPIPEAVIAASRPVPRTPPTPPPPPLPFYKKNPLLIVAPVAALLAIAVGAWMIVGNRGGPATAERAPGSSIALDLNYPSRIKPHAEARLVAGVSGGEGPSAYTIEWHRGGETLLGSTVSTKMENDTEFNVVVRETASGTEVLRRTFKVEVDVQPKAAEREFYTVETGAPLRLQGNVTGGGSAEGVESRWVDAERPDRAISNGPILDLPADVVLPGRRTYALQARRKGEGDWASAASDRVVIEVTQHVPPQYKLAMKEGSEARAAALKAENGEDAMQLWRKALAAFEKAANVFPEGGGTMESDACRQRMELDRRYLGALGDARRLRDIAEAIPVTEGTRRLDAWSESLRLYSAALVVFDRAEARGEMEIVEEKKKKLMGILQQAEQERSEYEKQVAKARHSAREAKKYVSIAVALPHWEDAADRFEALAKRFPLRAEEFTLELKEVQENRDKVYMTEVFGVVPAAPMEAPQPDKAAKPEVIADEPEAPRKNANPPPPPEPVKRIPEPFRPAEPRPSK